MRARAALERLYPDQARYLFNGLNAQTGAGSVGSVHTFLDRVAALRDGTDPERADSRNEDKAAVQLLIDRRILTPDIEAHLRNLIQTARALAPEPVEPDLTAETAYQTATEQLHAWLTDWRETARAVVTRRDYLISLGLAERRAPKVGQEEETPTPVGAELVTVEE